MEAIRQQLATRALTTGEKLPSIRRFAAAMDVSPSTVVEAYDRLAAEGTIRARLGSGFYVSGSMPPLKLAEVEARRDRAIDPLWVSRQSLDSGTDLLKPGCGWLPTDWMPTVAMRSAIRNLAKDDTAALAEYSNPHGQLALRRLLARQFANEGIEAGANQILLTSSGLAAGFTCGARCRAA
jgi:DNA-binding transcriptional MocR family regulator